MNKSKINNLNGEIVTLEQAAKRVNLGISTVRIRAEECGAALKIGRSYRINIQKLIDYLSSMTNTKVQKANKPIAEKHKLMPKGNTVTTLRINKQLLDDLHVYAEMESVTLADFTNYILTKGFEAYLEEKDDAN